VGDGIGDFLFTVARRLNGRLNVADLLECQTVLIVVICCKLDFPQEFSTNEIIFQFADFKDENAKLISNIGNIIIAFLAPNRKLFRNLLSLSTDLQYKSIIHYCI